VSTQIDDALRSDFIRQIEAAQQGLQVQLDALRLTDSSHLSQGILSQGSSRFLRLNALRDQIAGGLGAGSLASLRASVASAVADVRAFASDARSFVSAAQGNSAQSSAVALQQASEVARANVAGFTSDYYDRHVFDRWLTFSSASDEEEFRRREDERKHAIDKALGDETPEGNLRANQLAIDQLKDAGAHGADRSPQYQPELKRLESGQRGLAHQLAQQGKAAGQLVNDTSQGTSTVPPELIAQFKAANVALADPAQEGHGVTAYGVSTSHLGRS
jgi:hypothetical protein